MTKKQRALFILKLLNKKGYKYEVLSSSGTVANHVRVKGFGDIWPSTGTFRIGEKTYKNDLEQLVERLGGTIPKPKMTNTERIEALEEENKKLWDIVNHILER
jgi:hypothetical protein